MPLKDELRALADRVQADLQAGSDYYEHTKIAWRLVDRLVAEGRPISIRDMGTGTKILGPQLVGLAQTYVTGYLAESVFQHFVALFEDFTFGLLEAWLLAHPRGIPHRGKTVPLTDVIEARDRDSLIRVVVAQELDGLKYKRPAAWFKYLNDRVGLGLPTDDQVERLVELKASRDILIHNRGVVNETYLDKAGPRARYPIGQRLEIQEPYLRDGWVLIRQVVRELSAAAIAKA